MNAMLRAKINAWDREQRNQATEAMLSAHARTLVGFLLVCVVWSTWWRYLDFDGTWCGRSFYSTDVKKLNAGQFGRSMSPFHRGGWE
jgi:hypothetical protein